MEEIRGNLLYTNPGATSMGGHPSRAKRRALAPALKAGVGGDAHNGSVGSTARQLIHASAVRKVNLEHIDALDCQVGSIGHCCGRWLSRGEIL